MNENERKMQYKRLSRNTFHSLTLIVGGQPPLPCCCITALLSHELPVSKKIQNGDKCDHSSSWEILGMNKIPHN